MSSAPEPEPNVQTASPRRFPCEQCGAEVTFVPGTSALVCAFCGFEHAIDSGGEAAVRERDYRAILAELAGREETQEVETVACRACGANVDRPPDLDAFACAFCGTNIVATAMSTRVIKPRSLLPFHVSREQAHAAFRAWIAGRWFAPRGFRRFARSGGRLEGMYLPYWTYDSRAVSSYTGQRGEHYWVTETYTTTVNGKQVTRTRQVQRTRWHHAAGTVENQFDDLLVPASASLPERSVRRLEPWDLEHLVPFQADYLAGFRAERYQVDLEEGFAKATDLMTEPIRVSIRRDIGGDEQRINSVRTSYHDVTFKHLLLPVWITAYRYRDRAYRILINARTGEVQGERPWSVGKIVLAVLGGIAVAAGVVMTVMAVSS